MTEEQKADGNDLERELLDEAASKVPAKVPGYFEGDEYQNADGTLKKGNKMGGPEKHSAIGVRCAKQIINKILTEEDTQEYLEERLREWFWDDPIDFLFSIEELFDKEEKRESQTKQPLRIIHEVEST